MRPPPATPVLLVVPSFRLATGAVFAELRASDLASGRLSGNDLLAPALRLRPELGDLMRHVAGAGVDPAMTGSGPTLFSLVDDPERAAAVARSLRERGLTVIETRLREEAARIVALDDPPNGAGAP